MSRRVPWLAIIVGLVCSLATARSAVAQAEPSGPTIRVGSKNFTEQFVVAELYAGALEAAGFRVERKINLGATLVVHEALRTGAIDVYPEYTGTGFLALMKEGSTRGLTADTVYAAVKAHYEREYGLHWLKPSAVNNGYAIVVRRETAAAFGLRTLSDLRRVSAKLRLGAGSEFFDRYDGLPGLRDVYGITFAESRQFAALRLRYEALAQKQVDVANGFSTDWQIGADRFVALEDDKALFPPYHLAPVARMAIAADPKLVAALERVNRLIDNPTIQELNRQVEVERREPRRVADDFLREHGIAR